MAVAVLLDLFHALACVPPPASVGMPTIPEVLGVPAGEWDRLDYGDDVLGRCVGARADSVEIMRTIAVRLIPQ